MCIASFNNFAVKMAKPPGIHCLFNLDISVQSYFYFNFDICTTLYFHPLRQLSAKVSPFSYFYFNSSHWFQESLLSLKIMHISDKSGTDHFLKRSKSLSRKFLLLLLLQSKILRLSITFPYFWAFYRNKFYFLDVASDMDWLKYYTEYYLRKSFGLNLDI